MTGRNSKVEWFFEKDSFFSSAKPSKTRESRITSHVERIMAGKGLEYTGSTEIPIDRVAAGMRIGRDSHAVDR